MASKGSRGIHFRQGFAPRHEVNSAICPGVLPQNPMGLVVELDCVLPGIWLDSRLVLMKSTFIPYLLVSLPMDEITLSRAAHLDKCRRDLRQ